MHLRIEDSPDSTECLAACYALFSDAGIGWHKILVQDGHFQERSIRAFLDCIELLGDLRVNPIKDVFHRKPFTYVPIDKARFLAAMIESVWRLQATQLKIALEPICGPGSYKLFPQIENVEAELKASYGLPRNAFHGHGSRIFLPIHNKCLYLSDRIRNEMWQYDRRTNNAFDDTRWTNDSFEPLWLSDGVIPVFNISFDGEETRKETSKAPE